MSPDDPRRAAPEAPAEATKASVGGPAAFAPGPGTTTSPLGGDVPDPGSHAAATRPLQLPDDDVLPPSHDASVGSTADVAFVELASSAVEVLEELRVEPEDKARAMAVGLLVGGSIGLVIDALLSRLVFSGL